MIEEGTVEEAGPTPPARGHRRLLWSAAGLAGVAGAALALAILRHPAEEKAVTPPFNVTRDGVDIREGAPTWSYLQFARAALDRPVPAEPVPGRVSFDEARSMPLVAPLPGRVDTVSVRLGQRVAKGDRLLAVRSPALIDLVKEIDLIKSKEAARAKAVERLRALVDLKAEPEKDLVAAEQDLRQVQLNRDADELKLRSLSVASAGEGLYWLEAPRDGVVVARDVLMGQEVGPERGDPLLVVAELDEVIVTADVPEADVADLEVGQPATILSSASPSERTTGRIEYIGEVVDPVRRMVNVRVRVRNQNAALRPNAFVQVTFAPRGGDRIVIPADAVVTDDQKSFVFVRSREHPGSLERRAVIPGHQLGGRIEINTGLHAGEEYVTRGAILLLNAIDLAQE